MTGVPHVGQQAVLVGNQLGCRDLHLRRRALPILELKLIDVACLTRPNGVAPKQVACADPHLRVWEEPLKGKGLYGDVRISSAGHRRTRAAALADRRTRDVLLQLIKRRLRSQTGRPGLAHLSERCPSLWPRARRPWYRRHH